VKRVLVFMALAALVACGAVSADEVPGRWVGQWHVAADTELDEVPAMVDREASHEVGVPEMDYTPVFGKAPSALLHDVDEVLSPGATVERMEFLRHHADESLIGLQVYLFNEGANPPVETGIERFFTDAKVAVVFYFLGEPQRSGLYFSPPLAGFVSEAEQRRSLQSSVMQAVGKADVEPQFEAFLTQMAIRLYWMERMIDGGIPVEPEAPAEVDLPVGETQRFRLPDFSMPENGLPWLAGGAIVLLGLPVACWARVARARYRFPEFKVEPRLGGRHAAGVGAVISYLSPNLPPAAQREQMMEFSDETRG